MKATKAFSTTFTYTLGKSLYVPLTSRCNSLTLPQTRGPNFLLPTDVVNSLLNVRSVEKNNSPLDNLEVLSEQAIDGPFDNFGLTKRILPAPIFVKEFSQDGNSSDGCYPSEESLLQEIQFMTQSLKSKIGGLEHFSNKKLDAIVIAGEGEPTLRLGTILNIARGLRSESTVSNEETLTEKEDDVIPMRLVTNGLPLAEMKAPFRKSILSQMKDEGITEMSVALMTSCPRQYENLMQPLVRADCIHDKLCETIRDAIKVGMDVELTGVEHDFVDKNLASELAIELGVKKPFRWRPFFP
jgi:hypothetical protein